MKRDELKTQVYNFLLSRDHEGASLDDLLDEPLIAAADRSTVQDALNDLFAEGKIAGQDLIYTRTGVKTERD